MVKPGADDFRIELSAALKNCGLGDQQASDSVALLEKIQKKFVVGNPRAWWTGLKNANVLSFEGDSGYLRIAKLAPPSVTHVWFVVDECNEEEFIFNVPIHAVSQIIKECRYFEYYVVSPDFYWLLAENDHGDLLLVTDAEHLCPLLRRSNGLPKHRPVVRDATPPSRGVGWFALRKNRRPWARTSSHDACATRGREPSAVPRARIRSDVNGWDGYSRGEGNCDDRTMQTCLASDPV
ncbi:hypothetical protein D3C85_490430 [compost metagenome]